jgi:hypothetical protein
MASFDLNSSDDQILRIVKFPQHIVDEMSAAEKKAVADEFRRSAGVKTEEPKDPIDAEFTEPDTPAPYIPHYSSAPPPRPWGRVLIFGALLVGAVYWFLRPAPATHEVEPPVSPPGWDDLASCGALASLDEAMELELSADQRAELRGNAPLKEGSDPQRRIIDGVWSYDAGSKRYAITLNGDTTTYSLLARGEPTTCILFKGDIRAADLIESWFSFPTNDDPRDYDYDPGPDR